MLKFIKLLIVIIGSILVGLGIAIAVSSGFGADPITVLWDGITQVLSVTIGQASMLLAIIMLIIVLILDRKQINIGTLVNPFIVGAATDFFVGFNINSDNFIINIMMLLLGLVILGFGLALYSFANFGRGSYEALVLSIVEKYKFKLVYVRYCFDLLFLILGVVLGAKLSIGPIVAFLSIGYMIQIFMNVFKRNKLLCQIGGV